jgi:hypothetical protein
MAILKSVVQVNNGNTGWTKANVLNALEETFTNLGFHGGSQVNGVLTTTLPPGSTNNPQYNGGFFDGNWRFAGGGQTNSPGQYTTAAKNYVVTASGSSAYVFTEFFVPTYISTGDTFTIARHELTTGTPVVFSGSTTININGGNLINNQTYYVIVINSDSIKLATSEANANAGTAIDITNNYSTPSIRLTRFTSTSNPNISVYLGDVITFDVNAAGQNFYLTGSPGQYASNKVLNTTNYGTLSYRTMPTNQGVTSGVVVFTTNGWLQGDYYYVSQNSSSMTGTITLLPNTNISSVYRPYWDYTVPASGSRSAATFRVSRRISIDSYNNSIAAVEVVGSNTSGWSNDEVFTIPGTAIGGTSPLHDITFGVNSATSNQQTAFNAVPSVKVTNYGAGSNFYQKYTNQNKAILKLVNDPAKTYGTTYYGFALRSDNDYEMYIGAGIAWETFGYDTTSSDTQKSALGWGGTHGLDYSSSDSGTRSFPTYNTGLYHTINYASSTTPTGYPLKIITYRAQSPQDTNFAIIQFVQTINGIDYQYGTFFLHKGTNYGPGIWDLNHVYQGCFTQISEKYSYGEGITFTIKGPSTNGAKENLDDRSSTKREAFYGYYRDATDAYSSALSMTIKNNIFSDNENNDSVYYGATNSVLPYYRNSAVDKYGTVGVSSGANYYRPIKGLPINSGLAPVPYYLPDDFAVIPFAVTPGATAFRVGDTITVSPSEIYEIVVVAYSTNQTTFDNITNNTSKGIAFCARTT